MINPSNVFQFAKLSWKKSVPGELGRFCAANQGCKMVQVVEAVKWPKAGAVNKLDKRKRPDWERDASHLLILAALKFSVDKFCT